MAETPPIPDGCQWGLFLRNHDELTLEMVTDAERDEMYAEYAKDPKMRRNTGIGRRLAPLLDNQRPLMELFHALLFSMPGSPILYYGDEIGMGDNIHLGDRDGVRTPMQWTPDRNAGFSTADFEQLYLAAAHGPGLRVPGGERGGRAAQPGLVPALAAADDRLPQAPPPARRSGSYTSGRRVEPGDPRLPAGPVRGRPRDHPVRGQPLAAPRSRRRSRCRSSTA